MVIFVFFQISEKELPFKIASFNHKHITATDIKCFGGNNPTVLDKLDAILTRKARRSSI